MQSSFTTLIGAIRWTDYVYIVIEYRRSTGMRTVNEHVKMRDIVLRRKRPAAGHVHQYRL